MYFLYSCVNNFSGKWGRGWSGVKVGRQFRASFRKYFETNRIFSVALVYCDKMSTIASLGAKEEIKRQRIKFSDSDLDLANIEANGRPYSLWYFPLQFCLTTMAQEQKLFNFFDE